MIMAYRPLSHEGARGRCGIVALATGITNLTSRFGGGWGAPPPRSTTDTCTYPLLQQHRDGKLPVSACTRFTYSPGTGKVAVVVASFLSTVSPPSGRMVLSEKITSPGGPRTGLDPIAASRPDDVVRAFDDVTPLLEVQALVVEAEIGRASPLSIHPSEIGTTGMSLRRGFRMLISGPDRARGLDRNRRAIPPPDPGQVPAPPLSGNRHPPPPWPISPMIVPRRA